ncbi:uncharacterized protein TRAVEDRAFT_42615 [Trametes versicolor FP-101664 SS1]|uniref:uncharacterized protein n=1 Tax=Trametes versicolor (strain FP-101664) TaxID=717944 RepID=UPI0004622E37|nr:uncharacterized protein TRAVEDRAFT_42615 [Trametes versicolor FP-101664 SS1]EIW65236.1 hypothetical protein TRAVEDRAFT_42615 [Trametes versicolor FP-101664 SS1]
MKIIGSVNATLSGRIGTALVEAEGIVDVLMRLDNVENESKDSRAHILVAPPGADPKHYVQKPAGDNGCCGRGRRSGSKMDVDR